MDDFKICQRVKSAQQLLSKCKERHLEIESLLMADVNSNSILSRLAEIEMAAVSVAQRRVDTLLALKSILDDQP